MAGNWSGWSFWAGQEEIGTEVVVVLDVESVNINLSQKDLVEGEEMKVTCRVEGGTPKPEVTFMMMKDNHTKINDSKSRFTNIEKKEESGLLEVVATLKPSVDDKDRLVCCHVQQWNITSQSRQSLNIHEEVYPRNLITYLEKLSCE